MVFIETATVDRDNLAASLAMLEGCWKSSSLLWMHANSFPVLSGFILGGWSDDVDKALSQFCRQKNVSELLVRIETPGRRWTSRRGGYTIPQTKTRELVEQLACEGCITILLEPAGPCADLYSLTSVCDVDTGKIDVEVVGPGFDASDILRADVTPHERFELSDGGTQFDSEHRFRVMRTYVIDQARYKVSVRRRLEKIGARLRSPSFPDQFMPPSATTLPPEQLAHEAVDYLRASGQTVLLDHSKQYEPIPAKLLGGFTVELFRLSHAIATSSISWRTFSMAGTFLSADQLVIWDFFSPRTYDTQSLVDLEA
jgi:hypothetical protein